MKQLGNYKNHIIKKDAAFEDVSRECEHLKDQLEQARELIYEREDEIQQLVEELQYTKQEHIKLTQTKKDQHWNKENSKQTFEHVLRQCEQSLDISNLHNISAFNGPQNMSAITCEGELGTRDMNKQH